MCVPIKNEACASGACARAKKFECEGWRAKLFRFGVALRVIDAPSCPRGAGFGARAHKQTVRTVALGKQQQPARGFEIERLAAAAQRANHHRAARSQRLLSRPKRLVAFGAADDDQLVGVEPVLREANRIRRAVFREHALFTRPDHPWRTSPGSR